VPTNTRDPLIDPQPGDVVQPMATRPKIHAGEFRKLTVWARVGFLVAYSTDTDGNKEIFWSKLSDWCEVTPWISYWKVVHRAD